LVTDSETATVALARAIALDGQNVADVVLAEAAPRGRNGDAEQSPERRGVHHVGRKFTRLVDAGRPLHDNLARELLDLLLEGFLFGV